MPTCPETPVILHKCMAAPGVEGTVTWVAENGSYTVNDTVVRNQPIKTAASGN